MHIHYIIVIYFFYGLAFFSMGLLVIMEGNRASDQRLRMALRPLAGFGIVHGLHEWVEMFDQIELLIGAYRTNYSPVCATGAPGSFISYP